MCNKNIIYLHSGLLFNYKENEIAKFTKKWVELEIIILSEITQT